MENEKRKKIVDNVVMHKNCKEFDEAKCKIIDKTMFEEFNDQGPLGSQAISDIKLVV